MEQSEDPRRFEGCAARPFWGGINRWMDTRLLHGFYLRLCIEKPDIVTQPVATENAVGVSCQVIRWIKIGFLGFCLSLSLTHLAGEG